MTLHKKVRTIKELRMALNLTQIEFGEKVDVGQPVISAWESGTNKPCFHSYKKLLKLAKSKGLILEIE